MGGCHRSQRIHRIQQPAMEPLVAARHDGQVHLAALQALRLLGSAAFHEFDLHTRMPPLVVAQERR